jgi:hypothetical protein
MNNFTPISAVVGRRVDRAICFPPHAVHRPHCRRQWNFRRPYQSTNRRPHLARGLQRQPYRCACCRCACWLPRPDAADTRQLHQNCRRRTPGWVRRPARQRLHLGSRNMRHRAVVITFDRNHWRIHGDGNRRGCINASHLRRLT